MDLKVDTDLKCEPPNVDDRIRTALDEMKTANPGSTICTNSKPFPSNDVLVELASIVYEDLHLVDVELPEGWKLIITGRNSINKYYGAVFSNSEDRQIVIAHRGTSSFGAVKADLESIVNNVISGHMMSAVTFAWKLINALKEYNNEENSKIYHQVSATGHSLGGWLAHITAFTVKYLKMHEIEDIFIKDTDYENNHHVRSVTFDNPGCSEMLQKLRDVTTVYYDKTRYGNVRDLDLNSYLSAPNRINCCNRHCGNIFRIILRSEKNASSLVTFTAYYNLAMHAIENFVQFKKELTNFKYMVRIVTDWPRATIKDTFKTLNPFTQSEFDQVFQPLNSENDYHTDESLTGFRYSANETPKPNMYSASTLNAKEKAFLRNIAVLNQGEIITHNTEVSVAEVYQLLLSTETSVIGNRNRVFRHLDFYVSEKQVSLIKQLLFYYPKEMKKIEKQVVNKLATNYEIWKIVSEQFVEGLNTYGGYKFLDLHFVTTFIDDVSKKRLWIKTKSSKLATNIVELLYKCKTKHDSTLFLRWQQIKEYTKNTLKSLFNYKLLVILYEDEGHLSVEKFIPDVKNKIVIVSESSCKIKNDTITKIECTEHIAIKHLTAESRQQVKQDIRISFNGKATTLNQLVESGERTDENRQKCEEFINELRLDELISDLSIIVGLNKNQRTFLDVCTTKLCKTINDMNKFFSYVNDSNETDTFIITGISKETFLSTYVNNPWNTLMQQFPSKIEFWDGFIDETLDVFYSKCNENMSLSTVDKVFRLHAHEEDANNVKSLKITCEEIYNKKLLMERKLIVKNTFNRQFCKIIAKDENTTTKQTIIVVGFQKDFETYLYYMRVQCKLLIRQYEIIFVEEVPHPIKNILDFETKFQKKVNRPCHMIQVTESDGDIECFWLDSEGSIDAIYSMVEADKDNLLDVRNMDELPSRRIVIVADEAGTGKSTIMKIAANELKSKGHWVFQLNLNELKEISKRTMSTDLTEVIKFLQEFTPNHEFKTAITNKFLQADIADGLFKQVYLFCDAFDEIRDETLTADIVDFLKRLKQNTKINCWISTRTYRMEHLERQLSTFSVSIKEIEEEQRTEYVKEIWKIGSTFGEAIDENDLTKCAAETLEQIRTFFGHDAKTLNGNPLHLRLMAEALQTDISLHSNIDEALANLNNLYTLYNRFVENKFLIYFDKNACDRAGKDVFRKNIKTILQRSALHQRFPKITGTLFGSVNTVYEPNESEKDLLLKIGLFRSDGRIFHETINEYYCASYILELLNIKTMSPEVDEWIWTDVFLKQDHKIIRHFINGQTLYHAARKLQVIELVEQKLFYNEKQDTFLHVLVSENQANILQYTFACCKLTDPELLAKLLSVRNEQGETPLYMSRNIGKETMLDDLLVEIEQHVSEQGTEEVLLASMFRRCYDEDDDNENIANIKTGIEKNGLGKTKRLLNKLLKLHFWEKLQTLQSMCWNFSLTPESIRRELDNLEEQLHRKYLLLFQDTFGYTILHYVFKSGSLETIKYLLNFKDVFNLYRFLNCSPLFKALENKNKEAFGYLIKTYGFDYNSKDKHQNTILHRAAEAEHLPAVQYLLKSNINIKATNILNETALDIANKTSNFKIIASLEKQQFKLEPTEDEKYPLQHAVRANNMEHLRQLLQNENIINAIDRNNRTALHYAVIFKNGEAVKILLDHEAKLNISDMYGNYPLHYATRAEDSYILKLVLGKETDVNKTNKHKETSLHVGIAQENIEAVKHLLEKGADRNIPEKYGWSPLHYAARAKDVQILKLVIKTDIELNKTDGFKQTPLHVAIAKENVQAVRVLLKKGADINIADGDGWFPVHYAANAKDVNILKAILERETDVNKSDRFGQTPLHVAIAQKNIQAVQVLLEKGADINIPDENGWFPLHYASELEDVQILKAILETETNVNKTTVYRFNQNRFHRNEDETPYVLETSATYNDNQLFLHNASKPKDVQILILKTKSHINKNNSNKETALHVAIKNGNIEGVKLLLAKGANINISNEDGWFPLHYAAASKDVQILKQLLGKESDINKTDKWKQTALHVAVAAKNIRAVRVLLKTGADINIPDEDGWFPLHYASQLNDVQILKIILEKETNVNKTTKHIIENCHFQSCVPETTKYTKCINIFDDFKCQSVSCLVAQPEARIVDERNIFFKFPSLNNSKKATVNKTDIFQATALHVAIKNENQKGVEMLLEKGADILDIPDKYGRFPLHFAAAAENVQILNHILEKEPDVNKTDNLGQTALMVAFEYDNLEGVRLLLDKEADLNIPAEYGQFPLHYAATVKDVQILKQLLEKETDFNKTDKWKQTGLHLAIYNENIEGVKLLLEKGADINIPDEDGWFPLHYAARVKDVQILLELLQNETDINKTDKRKRTALHVSINHSNIEGVELLLEMGADINISDEDGRFPLHYAAAAKDEQILNRLLEKETDVNRTNRFGGTALHVAIRKQSFNSTSTTSISEMVLFTSRFNDNNGQIIKRLVEKGANVNKLDCYNKTPLQYAVEAENIEAVKILLEHGANPYVDALSELMQHFLAVMYAQLIHM